MSVSKKQLAANRRNAKKGGPKTPEGKAVIKYNALKHGLLAKETIVSDENPGDFKLLLEGLRAQLKPAGTIEEVLTEKIAIALWRLKRAYGYESGLIIRGKERCGADKEIKVVEEQIEAKQEIIAALKTEKDEVERMYEKGVALAAICDWEGFWCCAQREFPDLFPEDEFLESEKVREVLSNAGLDDELIWQRALEGYDRLMEFGKEQIADLEEERDEFKAQMVIKRLTTSIPSKENLERLLKYEGAIERQFYKALNQLERIQRLRSGDKIPAPVEVDVTG